MAEPLEYDIVLNMQRALQAISVAGGYHYDVAAAAVSIDPHDHLEVLTGSLARKPFLIVEVSPGRHIQYFPGTQMRELIPIEITAATDAQALVATSRAQTFQRLCADIEKALTVDVTRNGKATDTRILDKRMGIMVSALRVMAVVQTEVRLHRTYGAPNG